MVKILVIGLDGATFDLLKPWADEGKLPTFKKLMENGVWGELESTIPPWTIPAWESMSTGKNPDKLFFSTFMVKVGYNFVPHIFRFQRNPQIWNILSENGYKVIAANLPNIYKPDMLNGNIVCGWLYRDKENLTYPKKLINEINNYCNGYIVDIMDFDFDRGKIIGGLPPEKNLFKQVEEMLKKRVLAFKYLLEKEWDFAFLVFTCLDRVQHATWDKDKLLVFYKKIDEGITKLLKNLEGKTNVIFVSDHGFGKSEYSFNVNEWLIKEGYLEIEKGNSGSNLLMKTKDYMINQEALRCFAKKFIKFSPAKFRFFIANKTGSRSFDALKIDWGKTKAFAYGSWGDIYINLKGREPKGVVDIKEYGKIKDEIIEKLKNLRHPKTGKKMSGKAFKKEEIYNGPLDDNKPDIVILPTDGGIESITPGGSGSIFTPSKGGNHRLNGIFLIHGPEIKKGVKISNATIYDITPTILHMFNLPVPDDMDGKVLKEIFDENSEFAKREIKYKEVESEKKRLKEKIGELKARDKI
jgi:predicted AlkP superfamily phosphohydrolase/phosphomutase